MEANTSCKWSNARRMTEIFHQTNIAASPFSEFYMHHRHKQIWQEFENIMQHPIPGIYVFPSLKSLQVWHGVLFVKTGLYAEGIFHFLIILDDEYPYSKPVIRFTSNIIHPRITKKGNFNVSCSMSNDGKGGISKVLDYIRSCFINVDIEADCTNNASYCINQGSNDYKALIRGCVLESLYDFEERAVITSRANLEIDNPFDATLLSDKSYQSIKETILSQSDSNADKRGMLYWTRSAIGRVWDNLS